MVLLEKTLEDLQRKINLASTLLGKLSLEINPKKVRTLHLTGRTPVGTRPTLFKLQDTPLRSIGDGDIFQNLGKPFSIPALRDPTCIQDYKNSLLAISRSKLAPWQWLEAIRDFWIPSFSFAVHHCYLKKADLADVDRLLNLELRKS